MAGQLQVLPQIDFSGGENLVASPYDLAPNQAQRMVNFILDEHGSARVRDGTLLQNSISPNLARPIVKIYDFVQVNGTVSRLAILLGLNSSSPNTLYTRSATPWTSIGDFTGSPAYSTIPDAVTFTNLVIFCNGNTATPQSYDGTTLAQLTGGIVPPGAVHLAVHLNYLWAWNTSNVFSSPYGPSSLQSSDLNNPNSWPAANQTFISRDDGQTGQGLAQFTIAEAGISPTASLTVWKDFTGYEATGVLGASGFSVQKIKSDMGCVAPRSIQFVSGFGIIRLTHRGFALYDGVNDTLISEEERPRIFGRDDITGLDWTYIGRSMSAQVANPPLYLCACPTSGPPLRIVFVYDLVRRSWTVLNFANDLSTLQLILDPGVLPSVLGGDYNAGYVRRYFAGDTTDDGTAINWTFRTRAFSGRSPMTPMFLQRFLIKVFGMTQGNTVNGRIFYGPSGRFIQKNTNKTIPTITAQSPWLGYGQDAYGTSAYGSDVVANTTDAELSYGGGVICNNAQLELQGTGPGRIRGVEAHVRPKPSTVATYLRA